ncbi:MAG: Serine/threonine-protein kinase tel1, partial [Tremellales sp. Tagirdzhanova-0007]
QKAGVLEFVGDSQGIGEWLKPAHARYGQVLGDIRSDKFRATLKPIQEQDENSPELEVKFKNMMEQFHPVMNYFFTEKHRDPMAWFAMRLNYTRSVAVTSIVGWVLGIGDRHCSNILIDQITGELVHIDFGIVFEEGQRLRIPEKVPFRLTNDLVDGLGVTGVDGTFRRCSEHTLRVLRESSALIMTVLEVFKHDPLYAWTGDPDKLQRAQGGGRVDLAQSATVQEKADRVLSRIRQKLRDDLSVEYRVNQLIQEATDVENLAKIFVGWQSWF